MANANSPPRVTEPHLSERLERLAKPKTPSAKEKPAPEPEVNSPGSGRKVTGCSDRLSGMQRKEPKPLPEMVQYWTSGDHPKKLSDDQLQKQLERLYTSSMARRARLHETYAEKYGHGTAMSVQRTDEEISSRVEFLAVSSLEQRRGDHKRLERKYLKSPEKRKLDRQAMSASAQRLHNSAIEHQKEVGERLDKLYAPPRPRKVIDSATLKESSDRLSATHSPR